MSETHAYHDTGSRCSGPGYGYSIVKGEWSAPDRFNPGEFVRVPAFGVRLSWQGMTRVAWTGDCYDDARELGYRFAAMGQAWHVYTSRQRALASGIAY